MSYGISGPTYFGTTIHTGLKCPHTTLIIFTIVLPSFHGVQLISNLKSEQVDNKRAREITFQVRSHD